MTTWSETPSPEALSPGKSALVVEWALRVCAIASYLYMLAGMVFSWMDQGRPLSLLALMATEAFTLALIVCARPAIRRDASAMAVLGVTYTSGFILFLDGPGTTALIPDPVAAAVQVAGLMLTLASKAAIGRAFGVLPAARRLVTRGPYRFVRHPMYLGYLMGNVGFLLSHLSWLNVLVIGTLMLVQVSRVIKEESVLAGSSLAPAFEAYRATVAYRLVPFVF